MSHRISPFSVAWSAWLVFVAACWWSPPSLTAEVLSEGGVGDPRHVQCLVLAPRWRDASDAALAAANARGHAFPEARAFELALADASRAALARALRGEPVTDGARLCARLVVRQHGRAAQVPPAYSDAAWRVLDALALGVDSGAAPALLGPGASDLEQRTAAMLVGWVARDDEDRMRRTGASERSLVWADALAAWWPPEVVRLDGALGAFSDAYSVWGDVVGALDAGRGVAQGPTWVGMAEGGEPPTAVLFLLDGQTYRYVTEFDAAVRVGPRSLGHRDAVGEILAVADVDEDRVITLTRRDRPPLLLSPMWSSCGQEPMILTEVEP